MEGGGDDGEMAGEGKGEGDILAGKWTFFPGGAVGTGIAFLVGERGSMTRGSRNKNV